jgi:hypothetical protein
MQARLMQPRIDAYMLTIDEPEHWKALAVQSLMHPDIRLEQVPTSRNTPIGDDWVACIASDGADYICFVDPDNVYEANAFIQMADALDSCTKAMLAYTDEVLIDAQGRMLGHRRLAYSRWLHMQRASLVHSCVLYRRCAARAELPFIQGLSLHPEWMLSLRLARRSPVLHLPVVGRQWRQHTAQAHHRNAPQDMQRIRIAIQTP